MSTLCKKPGRAKSCATPSRVQIRVLELFAALRTLSVTSIEVVSSLRLFNFPLELDPLFSSGPAVCVACSIPPRLIQPSATSSLSPSPSRPLSNDVSLVRPLFAIVAKAPVPIRPRRFPRSTLGHEPRCHLYAPVQQDYPSDYRLFLLCIHFTVLLDRIPPRSCVAH